MKRITDMLVMHWKFTTTEGIIIKKMCSVLKNANKNVRNMRLVVGGIMWPEKIEADQIHAGSKLVRERKNQYKIISQAPELVTICVSQENISPLDHIRAVEAIAMQDGLLV